MPRSHSAAAVISTVMLLQSCSLLIDTNPDGVIRETNIAGQAGAQAGASGPKGGGPTDAGASGRTVSAGGVGGTATVGGTAGSGATLGGISTAGSSAGASGQVSGGTPGGGASGATATSGGTTTAGGAGGASAGVSAAGSGIATGGVAGAGTGGVATGGVAGTAGLLGAGGSGDACAASQTRSCSLAGALGSCATGTQVCVTGKWGQCSVLPAATDSCIIGNDDNCNGIANDTVCKVLQVSSGAAQSCALLSDGMVRCWGGNSNGELGNGKTVFSAKPELVLSLRDLKSVDAGNSATCAVGKSGQVSCWGSNSDGQLGSGALALARSTTPIDIVLPAGVTATSVTVGDNHVCIVVESDGSVLCWGQSSSGQLGNGNISSGIVRSPVAVSGLIGVLSVRAGLSLSCATLAVSGAAYCWGRGDMGQNGDIASYSDASTPQSIVSGGHFPLTEILDVAVGPAGMHACALNNGGNAFCWGYDYFGQLGDGTSGTSGGFVTPVKSTNPGTPFSGFTTLTAGANHTCGSLTDGTGACWGNNTSGQLGDGTNTIATTPSPVSLLKNIVSIDAGSEHNCSLLENGTVWCWGANRVGQLGDNTTTDRNQPVKVIGLLP